MAHGFRAPSWSYILPASRLSLLFSGLRWSCLANPDDSVKVKPVFQAGVAVVAAGVAKSMPNKQIRDLGQHRTVEQIVGVTVQDFWKNCGGCPDYFPEALPGEYYRRLSKRGWNFTTATSAMYSYTRRCWQTFASSTLQSHVMGSSNSSLFEA